MGMRRENPLQHTPHPMAVLAIVPMTVVVHMPATATGMTGPVRMAGIVGLIAVVRSCCGADGFALLTVVVGVVVVVVGVGIGHRAPVSRAERCASRPRSPGPSR